MDRQFATARCSNDVERARSRTNLCSTPTRCQSLVATQESPTRPLYSHAGPRGAHGLMERFSRVEEQGKWLSHTVTCSRQSKTSNGLLPISIGTPLARN